MRGHPPPDGFRDRDWHQFKRDALDLLAVHGLRLAALAWTTEALFGVHKSHPAARVAASGLARFLHGGSVIELAEQFARIRRLTGAVLTYRRSDPQLGAVPAWELYQGENSMTDYSMDFDAGAGEQGPWLRWHAAPTRDGAHGPGTWCAQDDAGSTTVNPTNGAVFDWPGSVTGWMQTSGTPGVAPQKRWNASRARFQRQPGEDWKRALRIAVAYTPEARAVWEQASAAAWIGFTDLMTLLKATAPGALPQLPLVALTGHRATKLSNGMTLVPVFKVLRYVARPLCLPDEDAVAQASGDAWNGQTAPAPRTPATPQPPPSGSNGAAGGIQMAGGHTAPLPAGPAWPSSASGDEPLIDDEIPF